MMEVLYMQLVLLGNNQNKYYVYLFYFSQEKPKFNVYNIGAYIINKSEFVQSIHTNMELQNNLKLSHVPKAQNMLLLQQTILQTRCFPVYSLDDALQKMIKIYSEAMALQNSGNPEIGDAIRFSLKSMLEYYSSMQNIMFMQKDNSLSLKTKQKHKSQLQSYDKEFVIENLNTYCISKSTQKSIQLAKQIFKNGGNAEQILKNLGFSQ